MTTLSDFKSFVDNRFLETANSPELDIFLANEDTIKFLNDKRIAAKVPNRGGFKTFMLLAETGKGSTSQTWIKTVNSVIKHIQSKYKVKLFADICHIERNGEYMNYASLAYSIGQANHGMNSSLSLPFMGG